MTKDEVLKLALEALGSTWTDVGTKQYEIEEEAITAIKEALVQSEQEPVACVGPWHDGRLTLIPRYSQQTFERDQPLYTTPPQRTWVGLDHHDKKKFSSWLDHKTDDEVFTAIEAKLKELNT